MKKTLILILFLLLTVSLSAEAVILLHGFMGFGRQAIPGFYYWGGFVDLEAELNKAGFRTFTAEVGPVSSNWDRACELYAFIKGGVVDYGKAHSEKHGHIRYGNYYPGVIPEWGEEHRIHILGHSMGGQTARLLTYLLKYGDPGEREASPEDCSPLFLGDRDWVQSVTTFSTPHDGTTLLENKALFNTVQQQTIGFLAALSRLKVISFNFKLEQFGITPSSNKPTSEITNQIYNYLFDKDAKDTGTWDASLPGAKEFNRWVKTSDQVYYFSWATEATQESSLNGYHVPKFGMSTVLLPSSFFIGRYTAEKPIRIDSTWWQNDGVVNTLSMAGPRIGSIDKIIPYQGLPERGVWNYMGALESTDHIQVLGIGRDMVSWYINWISFLYNLE